MKKWKWLILLGIGLAVAMIGAALHEHIWAIFLMIFGMYGCGYAQGRIDEITGPVSIQIGIKGKKPYIKYIKG